MNGSYYTAHKVLHWHLQVVIWTAFRTTPPRRSCLSKAFIVRPHPCPQCCSLLADTQLWLREWNLCVCVWLGASACGSIRAMLAWWSGPFCLTQILGQLRLRGLCWVQISWVSSTAGLIRPQVKHGPLPTTTAFNMLMGVRGAAYSIMISNVAMTAI